MDYGIPLGWPSVDRRTFDSALGYVRDYTRMQFDVLVYSEARSRSRRAFAVEANDEGRSMPRFPVTYYVHPDLLDAMGGEMG